MKMRALNQREKILAAMVGVCLFVGFIKFFIVDRLKLIQETESQIVQEQQSLEANRAIYESLATRKLASVSSNVSNIDIKGYTEGNSRLGNILGSITDMEQDQRLFKITKLSSDKKEEGKGYERILFSLEIETSFLGLGTFLEKLENSKYLSRVESVSVNRLGTDLKKCSATVRFYTYVLRDS